MNVIEHNSSGVYTLQICDIPYLWLNCTNFRQFFWNLCKLDNVLLQAQSLLGYPLYLGFFQFQDGTQ